MAPIPVALCGKNPNMARSFVQTMGPQYEVVHVWHNTATAKQELPALLRGEDVRPESGLGSNSNSETVRAPKAVIVGAGFSRSELADMRESESSTMKLPWLYPGVIPYLRTSLSGADFMDSVVSRAKDSMEKNGLVEGREDQVKPDVWSF